MQEIKADFRLLPNIGICTAKLSEEHLVDLKQEINEIQNNFEGHKNQLWNKKLAGNLIGEYRLLKSINSLESIILPIFNAYAEQYSLHKCHKTLTHDVKVRLGTCWVNFMKKHEFNPVHTHSGIASFVIWIKIPYSIEDEKNCANSRYANNNVPGMFEFSYPTILGSPMTHTIPTDSSFENVLCMFPSTLAHTVYPFSTSDGYRISVSGNVFYDTYDSRFNQSETREIY